MKDYIFTLLLLFLLIITSSLFAQVNQQWVARYNKQVFHTCHAQANSIAVDGSGNIYITGVIDTGYSGGPLTDYCTIKYNTAGVQQWVAVYNGVGNSYDEALSIAVDGLGNAYVTGYITGSGTGYDYCTIKYNSAGVQQWVAIYSGPGNSYDKAVAIAVDASGNVYVTGESHGDFCTIKYNSAGVQQWVAIYNSPGNVYDVAYSIAVDVTGNVYVTGCGDGGTSNFDYVTVKYNSLGIQQWVARYNGQQNGIDEAYSIAIDGSGNVYVTGKSAGYMDNCDYCTIKYNSSGVQQWVARYDGVGSGNDEAYSLVLDGSNNVYVTGRSWQNGTYDYCTIKYNSSGVQQWVAMYNGPGNYWDEAHSITVDGSGNVYVTGWSYGNGTDYDYCTIKYNSSGVQQWIARYNGPGNRWDKAYSIALDGSGNVYVTGVSCFISGADYSCCTIKYSSAGVQQWVNIYENLWNSSDYAKSIAIDRNGNVYVTGVSYGSSTNYDYCTIKYNSAGYAEWVARYNGPEDSTDEAYSITVDSSGNVYVTGYSIGSGTSRDYCTIKYNSLGGTVWVRRYNGPGNGDDEAYSIAVDGSGNVYVTGRSYGSGTNYDYCTIKYNSAGVQQWVARYNGPGNGGDVAYSLVVDNTGNVYVTGGSIGVGTLSDYCTIKYNFEGVQQWVARYNGQGNSIDNANAIAIDESGNVYVTGVSYSGTDYNYCTLKYNSIGIQQWVAVYDGPGNDYDEAKSIVLDASSNVYVTGYSVGSGTGGDYCTIKYNSEGVQQWVARYNGPGNDVDDANSIAVDGSGNLYVTGGSVGKGTSFDFCTIKYSQGVNGIKTISTEVPSSFSLSQNYPNPFNPSTTIEYAIPQASKVTLKIYNVLGQEIRTLVNETEEAGTYKINFDARDLNSGIYIYILEAGNFTQVRKMILMK